MDYQKMIRQAENRVAVLDQEIAETAEEEQDRQSLLRTVQEELVVLKAERTALDDVLRSLTRAANPEAGTVTESPESEKVAENVRAPGLETPEAQEAFERFRTAVEESQQHFQPGLGPHWPAPWLPTTLPVKPWTYGDHYVGDPVHDPSRYPMCGDVTHGNSTSAPRVLGAWLIR
jgi:hypothetical protein